MSTPRFIFAGTPDFAAVHLKALLEADLQPVAVFTQPDRPAGRGHHLTPSPVRVLAEAAGIPVHTPENFRSAEAVAEFTRYGCELLVVVAYGLILPESILKAPRYGAINVHGSLLPRWRGAAPIQRALLAGDAATGVTLIRLVRELDAGPMIGRVSLPIRPDDTSGSLFDRVAELGAVTLRERLGEFLNGHFDEEPQDAAAVTYAAKITREEAFTDFNEDAAVIERRIRGYLPWPCLQCRLGGENYKLFAATLTHRPSRHAPGTIEEVTASGIVVSCSGDSLELTTMQAPGRNRVRAAELARARADRLAPGCHFEPAR